MGRKKKEATVAEAEVTVSPEECKTVDFEVSWQLSDEEIEQLKNEHLDNLNQIDDLTAKKKRTNDACRTLIKQKQNTNWTIREKIKDGKEQRKMPCKVIFDWDKGTKAIIHPQTGEVIEEQLITNEDRQMELGQ